MMTGPIPVVLFAYARTEHLARVLACLRANAVPRLEIYADGPKHDQDRPQVEATRALLRSIDWCEVRLVERTENFGLGRNILSGVTEVAARAEAFLVWEDDLIAVPGTYAWVCAALRRYAAEPRVMSVSAWTHPRVTPRDTGDRPYFDRRAECWVWGAWSRSWRGMPEETAREKLAATARRMSPDAYGGDLRGMAENEQRRNIWAVRWLYHHLQHDGLCLRPPWSMVDHLGVDASATNAGGATEWSHGALREAPPVPAAWPEPIEHPRCRALWRAAYPPRWRARWRRLLGRLGLK